MERIRRSLDERPQRKGLQWGAVVCALFVGYLGANVAGNRWNQKPSESPVAATRHEVVARATPDDTENGVASDSAYQRSLVGLPRRVANPDQIANNGEHFAPRALPIEEDHAPRPVGDYFNVEMPDGRHIHSVVRAAVTFANQLPFTGNRIGDARYVAGEQSWYVWTLPLGGNTAQWIDP